MTAPTPAMTRRAVTRRLPRAALDGGALSVRAWLLLAAGTAGGLVAMITITALASGCFVLARRFAAESGWRRWAVFAVAAGLATIVFIAAFGAAGGRGGLAGLWERAAGGATSVLTVAVLARLAAASRPAARACLPGPAAGEVA